MSNNKYERVLALDLHPRSFGYVVAESPNRLLDWGVRRRRGNGSTDVLVQKRLRLLIELWKPSVLLILRIGKSRKEGALLRRISRETEGYAIPLHISKKAGGLDKTLTKYKKAQLAAEQFPVLAWNLPPKRQLWEGEHYRMSFFTAAAAASSYLHERRMRKRSRYSQSSHVSGWTR
jgi:hypothetical protein